MQHKGLLEQHAPLYFCLLVCAQVSSVELERVVLQHVPAIIEAAAVGFPTPGGGPEQLHIFVVLSHAAAGGGAGQPGHADSAVLQKIQQECQIAIKQALNPLFKVHRVVQVASLPRTASNKVMRRLLKSPAAPGQSKI
jgi:acyl-coenzyme A synthetase/AMP-(fatty) acid ligase